MLPKIFLFLLFPMVDFSSAQELAPSRPYLNAALHVETWLHQMRRPENQSAPWPQSFEDRDRIVPDHTLYHGTAGIVLFYLELYRATGEPSFLERATRGAEAMLEAIEASPPTNYGLYTGLSGIWFVLDQWAQQVDDHEAQHLANGCLDKIITAAKPKTKWGRANDIISGAAGIGLTLLHATERGLERALPAAIEAGHRLVKVSLKTDQGVRWRMMPDYERFMPNFSHGTAGIVYFLSRLYAKTKEPAFLDSAQQGAAHLQALLQDQALICHHTPGGEKLFYLGWCHGPTGTARTFLELWKITSERQYRESYEGLGMALLDQSIPETLRPGFWNNVGQCCGSTGVASFALDFYSETRDSAYLRFAKSLTRDLMARGKRDAKGLRWCQAEHRVRPDLLRTHTGFAQGASGIGLWLLRLDAFQRGREFGAELPDSPY